MTMTNEMILKQFQEVTKAGNDVTLRDDNARAFILDAVGNADTLAKLYHHFATSGTGTIDKLGVKSRRTKTHKGINTTPDGTDVADEDSVAFTLLQLYLDAWIKNDNVFYTARTRGQDVRQAITSLMQKQFAVDIQDLGFNGDTTSLDDFLKQKDGFIKKAKANAASTHSYTKLPRIQTLTKITGELESKYVNSTFKWFMSRATNLNYVAEVQNRQTNLGDATIQNGVITMIAGYEVEIVDNMENDVILFTPYENLAVVFGFEVKYVTAGSDSTAVAKQATYHFLLQSADFVIREDKAIAYIDANGVEVEDKVEVIPGG